MTLPKQTDEAADDSFHSFQSYLEVDGCDSVSSTSASFVRGIETLAFSHSDSSERRDGTSADVLFSNRDSFLGNLSSPSVESSGVGTLLSGSVCDSPGHISLSRAISANDNGDDDNDHIFCTKDMRMAVDDVAMVKRTRSKSGGWLEEIPQGFPDKDGDTVLHLAVLQAVTHLSDLMRVLRLEGQVNFRNRLFQTPLHIAALTSQTAAIAALLQLGASLSVQDCHGNTPLHTACEREDLTTLRALLGLSSDSADDEKGAYSYLQQHHHHHYHHHDDVGGGVHHQTLDRRKTQRQKDVADALATKNYEGLTCLHIAVLTSNPHAVRQLLQLGADVNAKDGKSGRTALHFAVETGDLSDSGVLGLLLAREDIDLDAVTFSHQTALQLALGRGRLDFAELLLTRGACGSDAALESASDSYSDDEMDGEGTPYDDVCIAGQPLHASRGR